MNPHSGSLEDLRDIVELPAVSWWPLAIGWWIVFAILAASVGVLLYRRWVQFKANAYRRRSLRELATTKTLDDIANVLKRTALCAFPRKEIASLTGAAWCDWLGKTAAARVPANVAQYLTEGIFSGVSPLKVDEFTEFASNWIRNHNADGVEQGEDTC